MCMITRPQLADITLERLTDVEQTVQPPPQSPEEIRAAEIEASFTVTASLGHRCGSLPV